MLRRLVGRVLETWHPRKHADAIDADLRHGLDGAISALDAGDIQSAESRLRALAARNPRASAPHALLAHLLDAHSRDGARDAYERALEIDPAQPELRLGYAGLLSRANAPSAADREYERVLRERPDWAPALINYGLAKLARAQFSEAIALLERAAAMAPDSVEAHVNLSMALHEVPLREHALEHAELALRLDPVHPAALKNAAAIYCDIGNSEAARRVLSRRAGPGADGARIAAALALPAIVESRAEIRAVREALARDLARLEHETLSVRDPVSEIGVLAALAYHGENDRVLHEAIARLHLKACPDLAYVAPACRERRRAAEARIRVGIVSNGLYNHSVGRVTAGLIAQLDRERFAVSVFCGRPPFDAISNTIARDAVWITLPRDLGASREAIARRELDVLIYPDVGADPRTYFLTFARLAPVQCATWAYPVTSGVPNVDYFLSTDYFETDDAQDHYSETLVRLHDVAYPGYHCRPEPEPPQPGAAPNFDRGRRVYFCPQRLIKFHPDFDEVLAGILRRDRGGEIVISHDELNDRYWKTRVQTRLGRTAADVLERIVFVPRAPNRSGHLHRARSAHVVLDTLHYSGGTTSLEMISAGALVVTLPSDFNRGRHTYGFLKKMRFIDTIAQNPEQYVELAVRIANDGELREHLKTRQREAAAALYEDRGAVRQIEGFLERATASAYTSAS